MSILRLDRARAGLLVVDIQERLVKAMPPEGYARLLNRTVALIRGAQALGLPIAVTEQYRKGLGVTVPELSEVLGNAPRFEKLEFSAWAPPVRDAFGARDQLLIAGMETHVCVYQTARDLCAEGKSAVLCADAVLSRTGEDRALGLAMCERAGAFIASTELVLFDLLGKAGTPEFKAISAAVK